MRQEENEAKQTDLDREMFHYLAFLESSSQSFVVERYKFESALDKVVLVSMGSVGSGC
jgi:hypothetical protein